MSLNKNLTNFLPQRSEYIHVFDNELSQLALKDYQCVS